MAVVWRAIQSGTTVGVRWCRGCFCLSLLPPFFHYSQSLAHFGHITSSRLPTIRPTQASVGAAPQRARDAGASGEVATAPAPHEAHGAIFHEARWDSPSSSVQFYYTRIENSFLSVQIRIFPGICAVPSRDLTAALRFPCRRSRRHEANAVIACAESSHARPWRRISQVPRPWGLLEQGGAVRFAVRTGASDFGHPRVGLGLVEAQEGGVRIVATKSLASHGLVGVGVAIEAAVRAGVVGPDVDALGAAALFTRGLFWYTSPCGKNNCSTSPPSMQWAL